MDFYQLLPKRQKYQYYDNKYNEKQQLQCKLRKVHCQFYDKNQDILKILCPQARRHSSIFHTFEALGLGWPGGAGDDLGMV